MVILIIGADDDHRAGAVIQPLIMENHPFAVLDTRAYPYAIQLNMGLAPGEMEGIRIGPNQPLIPFEEITGVYYCSDHGFLPHPDDEPGLQRIVVENTVSAFWSVMKTLESRRSCVFINPIEAANAHTYKFFITNLFQQAGLPTPATLITNDGNAVRAFYEAHDQAVIFKPPLGQGFTEKLATKHLTKTSLAKLLNSPIQLQAYIPGHDVRAYVIDDVVFGVRIESDAVDINEDTSAKRLPVALPDDVTALCIQAAKAAGLMFTGIDLRETPTGEFYVIEANSSPDFAPDQAQCGYPIVETLINRLKAGV